MPYHGQYRQDEWVHRMFPVGYKGFFVEIGAYDGKSGSNTLFLEEELGWKGILVEPDPLNFAKCQVNRPSNSYNVALGDKNDILPFMVAGTTSSQLIPSHRNPADVAREFGIHTWEMKPIKCITLLELLKSVNAPKIIDYVSMDTENGEYDILKNFPFNEYTINALTIEHEQGKVEDTKALLLSNGFIHEGGCDIENWYIRSPMVLNS